MLIKNYQGLFDKSLCEGCIGTGSDGDITGNLQDAKKVITGCGTQMWGTEDSFFFAIQHKLDTNSYLADRFEIEMYTKDGLGTSSSLSDAKFGLHIRSGLDKSSNHFSILLSPEKGVHSYVRGMNDGKITDSLHGDDTVRGGGWLKIERNGDQFRAYYRSSDTKKFYKVMSEATIKNMDKGVYVGIALFSSSADTCTTATFEQFSMKVSEWQCSY